MAQVKYVEFEDGSRVPPFLAQQIITLLHTVHLGEFTDLDCLARMERTVYFETGWIAKAYYLNARHDIGVTLLPDHRHDPGDDSIDQPQRVPETDQPSA